jgi:hypothetical protein
VFLVASLVSNLALSLCRCCFSCVVLPAFRIFITPIRPCPSVRSWILATWSRLLHASSDSLKSNLCCALGLGPSTPSIALALDRALVI